MIRPKLALLSEDLVQRVAEEAFHLLEAPGVRVQLPEARQLLLAGGGLVDEPRQVVKIPEKTARAAACT